MVALTIEGIPLEAIDWFLAVSAGYPAAKRAKAFVWFVERTRELQELMGTSQLLDLLRETGKEDLGLV